MSEKKYLSKSDSLVVYPDYSTEVKCSRCGKWEPLAADNKWSIRFNQIEGSEKEYLCFQCWKKEKGDDKQDDIRWGQSWNLAVNLLSHPDAQAFSDAELKKHIVEWQRWFYEQLKTKQ